MSVKRGGMSPIAVIAVVAITGLVATGCSKSAPTARRVYITPSPIPATPTPVSATDTPNASASISAMPSASLVPTALPSSTAVSSATCTGSVSNQAFWAEAANVMKWDVYCPVLPAGWYTSEASYEGANGGTIHVVLRVSGGPMVEINEGAFCSTSSATCSPHESSIGKSAFGDLLGDLDALSGGGFVIYVNPGTTEAYRIAGSGMSQETFVAYAAALAKVARY